MGKVNVRLKPKEKQFVHEYMSNGFNANKAVLKVWDLKTNPKKNVGGKAYAVMHRPRVREYLSRLEDKMIEEGSYSIDKLVKLRDKGENDRMTLDASKAILDSANQTLNRIEKRYESQRSGSTNILFANLSDKELELRIKEALGARANVHGATQTEVEQRSDLFDGGDPGLQELGEDSQGGSEESGDGGEGQEEGTISSSSGTSQVNDDNHILYPAEDSKES